MNEKQTTASAPASAHEAGGAPVTEDFRYSELRYRRLFEAARDGILILDPETRRIVDVNPFLVELLGYSREQFIGKELFEIGLLKDSSTSRAHFRELQETGYIRYEDLPLKTLDGRRIAVECVCNLYEEGDRQIIQCNVRDISARKLAEAAHRASEERFRLVARAALAQTLSSPRELVELHA